MREQENHQMDTLPNRHVRIHVCAVSRMPRLGISAFVLITGLVLVSCLGPVTETRSASIFQSQVVLTLRDHGSADTIEACFARLRAIDAEMNMWDAGSELSRLNARAGQGAVTVSRDLLVTVERGLELARLTDGIFDPTVGPLVKLWGIGTDHARVPTEADIHRAWRLVDWRRVTVDPAAGTVSLEPGQALDFGALAKGYGAMEGARLLASHGVRSAVLDVGGCVAVIGSGPRGAVWRVGVQEPGAARGTPLGVFAVQDAIVDTSGVYERFFDSGGRRYAHIMDTRTGRPVESDLVSATVAMPRDENADGPALALLVLGRKAGLALADRLGLAVVLVGPNKTLYVSRAARGSFAVTDRSYTVVP